MHSTSDFIQTKENKTQQLLTKLDAINAVSSSKRVRRKRVPDKPNYPLNLWSIMKNCIGKELTKIPMPVNFSEPLSMLQRLTEDFEYSEILDQAVRCNDSCEQLTYVAAFTVSSYATTSVSVENQHHIILFIFERFIKFFLCQKVFSSRTLRTCLLRSLIRSFWQFSSVTQLNSTKGNMSCKLN